MIPTTRTLRQSIGPLLGGIVIMAVVAGCPPQQPSGPIHRPETLAPSLPAPRGDDPSLPAACERVRRVRDILGRMGLFAMDYYGRIDHQLWSPAEAGSGKVSVSKTIAPPNGKKKEKRAFDSALTALNDDRLALEIFREKLVTAAKRCTADLCPARNYDIEVLAKEPSHVAARNTPRRAERNPGQSPEVQPSMQHQAQALAPHPEPTENEHLGEVWTWHVRDHEPPTAGQWEETLLSLYNYTLPPGECPLLPALKLLDTEPVMGLGRGEKVAVGFALHRSGSSNGIAVLGTDCQGTGECNGCGSHVYHRYSSGQYCCASHCHRH